VCVVVVRRIVLVLRRGRRTRRSRRGGRHGGDGDAATDNQAIARMTAPKEVSRSSISPELDSIRNVIVRAWERKKRFVRNERCACDLLPRTRARFELCDVAK
jgi:hypothetical protein